MTGPCWWRRATVTDWPAPCPRALDGGADIDALVDRARRRSGQFSWQACAEGLASLYADAARAVGPIAGRR